VLPSDGDSLTDDGGGVGVVVSVSVALDDADEPWVGEPWVVGAVVVGDAVGPLLADGVDWGAVDEGAVTTLAPDGLVLAVVPVSDAVAGCATCLADCDGLSVLLPVRRGGWLLELSKSATTATTPHTARAAPPAMSLLLVRGEPEVRSVPGSWGASSS
jgi:hypothetical protein